MKYFRAEAALPAHLVSQIRAYVPEGMLYIKKQDPCARKWGEANGERDRLDSRNAQIRRRHQNSETIDALAEAYHLSVETIKRIVYRK